MTEKLQHDSTISAAFSLMIRVDANPILGTKNLTRMIALAETCRKRDANVTFVSGDIPKTLQRRIEASGSQLLKHNLRAGSDQDAAFTIEAIEKQDSDWTIIDGQHFDETFGAMVNSASQRLMTTSPSNHANLILDQRGITADPPSAHKAKQVIGGLSHYLFDSDFQEIETERSRNNARFLPKRLLVSFEDDIDNWTLTTMRSIENLNLAKTNDCAVDVIIGSDFAYEKQLATFCRDARMNVRIHRNVDRIATLLKSTDLAIVNGTPICFDLARTGIPAIAIATDAAQRPLVDALHEMGTVIGFDTSEIGSSSNTPGDTILPMNIHSAINGVIRDRAQRQSMSDIGKRVLDGLGAERIARRLHAGVLNVRGARIDDVQLLHQIAQAKTQRGESFEKMPSAAQHLAWTKETLNDRSCGLWIVADRKSNPLATVHLAMNDEFDSATLEVALTDTALNVHLEPVIYEKIARQALNGSNQFSRAKELVFLIKPSCQSSCESLEQVGCKIDEPTVINDSIALRYILRRDSATTIPQAFALKKSA